MAYEGERIELQVVAPGPWRYGGAVSARPSLLAAAARVVHRAGGGALTLDAVAREAGVSKGGLLYHFPTKRALIEALVGFLVAEFDAAWESARGEESGPGAWTRAYLTASLSPAAAELDAASAGLVAAVAEDPALLAPLRDAYARWDVRLLEDGLPPADVALVRYALDGLWFSRLIGLPPLAGMDALRARLAALAAPPRLDH